ncbi:hypothetical protein M8J77_000279 [Diaphorina citri]|nr:hypothetical protein M8J77_000279 [Diaphorina citri]
MTAADSRFSRSCQARKSEMIDCLYRSILKDLSSEVENMKHYTSFFIQGSYGNRPVGRRRISSRTFETGSKSKSDLFRAAASKIKIAMMIANLRDGT